MPIFKTSLGFSEMSEKDFDTYRKNRDKEERLDRLRRAGANIEAEEYQDGVELEIFVYPANNKVQLFKAYNFGLDIRALEFYRLKTDKDMICIVNHTQFGLSAKAIKPLSGDYKKDFDSVRTEALANLAAFVVQSIPWSKK